MLQYTTPEENPKTRLTPVSYRKGETEERIYEEKVSLSMPAQENEGSWKKG